VSRLVQAWADAHGYRSVPCRICRRIFLAAPGERCCDACLLVVDQAEVLVNLGPLHPGGIAGAIAAYQYRAALYQRVAARTGDRECAELALSLRLAVGVLRDRLTRRPPWSRGSWPPPRAGKAGRACH